MDTIKRPKPGEDENHLLKEQQQFFEHGLKSSATVVNKRKSEERRVSKFARNNHKREKKSINPAIQCVLGEIKEKIPECVSWPFTHSDKNPGFPEVFIRDETHCSKTTSIFSQHVTTTSHKNIAYDTSNCSVQTTPQDLETAVGSKSHILCGNDSLEIHEENIKKLSEMSMEEIHEEQKKLKETLDPKLLQFLLSRRQVPKTSPSEVEMDVMEDNSGETSHNNGMEEKCVRENSLTIKESVCTGFSTDNNGAWLHMNIVEEEKLQWVGDIPSVRPLDGNQLYNARFDFQGLLMPYVFEEIDVRKGLYHHGNEPERPGYSLEELYQLSRSSVLQQRVVALNIISSILENAKKGYYDVCFNDGLLTQLLDHEIFLLLRFALDDNTEIQLAATLSALKNLLCSEVDELCLDQVLGCAKSVWQPSLCVVHDIAKNKENELKETEQELKDHEMLKVDIVKGALRTDLIPRIRYILEVLKPGPKAVISCLEILLRLARHSHDTALAITCCPRLMQVIITNFLTKDWKMVVGEVNPTDMKSVYGVPLVEALKLSRILACQSRKIASDLIHKYSIMNSIVNYVSVDPTECSLPLTEVLRLSLESFYIWKTFIAYNLATPQFVDLYPVLMRTLHFHYAATTIENDSSPFSHKHGTAIISLIEQAVHTAQFQGSNQYTGFRTLEYHHVRDFSSVLEMCLSKWLNQLGKVAVLTFSAMKLVGATFYCLASLYDYQFSQIGFDTVSFLNDLENLFQSQILTFLTSDGYKRAIAGLKCCSCLLFKGELGSKRDPSSIPSLGCLMWEGKCIIPVLQNESPFPLLTGLFNFLLTAYTLHKGLDVQYIDIILKDSKLLQYVENLNKSHRAGLTSHWFTRIEIHMLVNFLKVVFLKCSPKEMFRHLAFKLVTFIQKDEKYLLHDIMKKIVFNSDIFQNSSSCKHVASFHIESSPEISVTANNNLVEKALYNIPTLWSNYEQYLNLEKIPAHNCSNLFSLTCKKQGTDPALPADWIYLPIIKLHKEEKFVEPANKELTSTIITTLQWIYLVEELRPDVATAMNVSDRFCCLSTVFLCGSDLFLDPVIHELLFACFNALMRDYKKIEFPASFYDKYTQLLEQFAAVSYGDSLFGQFLLLPLQQQHSPDLRKQVWSEHASVLRILSTPLNQLLFPVNEMLEPCETDSSLLLTYLHCLATGLVRESWSPVLHLVAVHHVATFVTLHAGTELAEHLKTKILKLGNKELQSLLLDYEKSSFIKVVQSKFP